LKKYFFGLAIAVALGFVGSQAAMADCTASGAVIGNAVPMRAEDAAEVLGSITLNCTAAAINAAPSTIIVSLSNVKADTHVGTSTQGATLLNPNAGNTPGAAAVEFVAPAAGTVIPASTLPAAGSPAVAGWTSACQGTAAQAPDYKATFPCPSLTATAALPVVVPPAVVTVSVTASTVTFNFTPVAATAYSFYIQGIRVNDANLAAGTAVTATVITEGGIGSKSNSSIVVGLIQPLLNASATAFTNTTTLSITSCGPAVKTPVGTPTTVAGNPDVAPGAGNSLKVTLVEGTPNTADLGGGGARSSGGWTDATASDSYINVNAAAPTALAGTQGIRFRVLLTGVPTNMQAYVPEQISAASAGTTATITPAGDPLVLTLVTGASTDGSGGTVLAAPVANQYDLANPTGGQIAVTYEVTVASLAGNLDTVNIFIPLTGIGPTGTGQVTGLISLAPAASGTAGTTNAALPQFTAGKGATVANVVACSTFLLFPWAVVDGTYDTGLAIANTTADPTDIGTTGQTGNVTLFFFGTNLTNTTAQASFSQVISPTGGLPAGATATFDLNSLKTKPFYGYIIAECGFSLAHGFAFIDTPNAGPATVAQGYVAAVINNPRLGSTAPAEQGGL